MDKSLFDTLSEFLPNDVLDEIANAHGLVSNSFTINETLQQKEESSIEELKQEESSIEELKQEESSIEELKQEESSTEELKLNNIFNFINSDFENKGSLRLFTSTDKIHYGLCNEDVKKDEEKILNLNYFIFPVSISKLKKVLELYKEIDDIFKGTDSSKWIPNFLIKNDGQGDFIKNDSNVIDYLFYLLILLLNNNGKQLQKSTTIYNNLKLEKITPELITNSDFYRKFLQKDKSEINIFINTLNNPKIRFLKYYLLNLYNSSRDVRLKNKLYFILNTYLKGIEPCNKNLNLNQYNDLKTILALIKKITEGEIELKKQLIDKINDLYEYWLFKTLIIYFNTGGLKLIDEKIYMTINVIDFLNIINNKLTSKILTSKYSKYKDFFPVGKVTDNIFYFEKIVYFKNNYELNNYIKDKIAEKKSEEIGDIDFESLVIGKSFIKEDFNGITEKREIEYLNKFKLSTIYLEKLERDGYKISITLGGNTAILGNNIDSKLSDRIISDIPHFHEFCKTSILTPDYILKIEKDGKLCGSIIMDAKFSKYPFFDNVNKEIDYSTVLKYYSELSKNFSTTNIGNNFPFKVIILFPGDKNYGGVLQKLNNYFQRNTNIIAVPLMVGEDDNLTNNLKYLENYINDFINEIINKR